MSVSVFDLFKIGIGPSSSHTVGPMLAAKRFIEQLDEAGLLAGTSRLKIELYGSLGATGKGHGTDKAVILGLQGETPEEVEVDAIPLRMDRVRVERQIELHGGQVIELDPDRDMVFYRRKQLGLHPNGMLFTALDEAGEPVKRGEFYSVGGGFVVQTDEQGEPQIVEQQTELKYPFKSGRELLDQCEANGLSISQLMLENELAWRDKTEINQQLLRIWHVMQRCVEKGCETEGLLPGGLKVKRRAPRLFRQLSNDAELSTVPLGTMDWVNLFALAVNEENAAGGRVVTAPTNGAAGIIPSVLHYYWRYSPGANEEGVVRFLLCAGAIGILYKENASISGAEVGCQGEVGSACSMAAGALTEVLGGTPQQVENAAEIGMEHNLGLTCDPVGGLVQVPCIERNAMGAVKAINAARMALRGDGSHFVSLDKVIKTMQETGADMQTKYKETSRGGLAVNLVEC
ncbi:MAG: L-serine ammonia-lyase [Candidatus Thiodiazotropha lotti]|uniref:L-serine dehydratase n=1 Tax=Candidatus Thiodiazotropha endoloripes TaxID=1818881 RepID=A0A1E2UNK8_9GAMM|nr:L-serine ammonia-lyase [Candidatus Thiodiazotropha endoloripes]MCG7899140.1 L-serine ammonia-lyase [Candidatus Thiodiazotropha weberae]MCG7993314.1 L-serine ammonia-lyase [Candidatus Thiodiazotropha lotti]MCG7903722.1 L-serine ammonia-lyase [Candidatus Thiodiazotropha weberae]MCG7915222.1 L-serine ammonia-lyase [Candidatus Thiodiazotropha weberae]MCG7998169.1 L-serine ammonia-lyase [Candidatus Thiodiazotropha lotti]